MDKKNLALTGMIISVVIILCGALTMVGVFGGEASGSSSAPYPYDSGYASFGADFYSYVSNNAAEAASATRTVANNQKAVAELLKNVCGIFLMGFGLMGFCGFGIVRASCTEPVNVAPADMPKEPEAIPAPEETQENTEESIEEEQQETAEVQ